MTASLRRLAAVAILGGVVVLVHLAVVDPLVGAWSGASRDIAEAQARLGALTALAGAAERLDSALAEREREAADAPAHYRAASDTLVAVQMQDRLKQAVDGAGGTLASLRVLPAGEEGPFRRVALRAQVGATLPALQRVLHALEASRPVLVLDNLSVTAPAAPAGADDPVLTVRFDVLGYARIEKP
ncbi:MAG: type II secretion system protein GspM [Pseudomonadota bacterium]